MIHILYLAAGSARRFGSNKLLHPLEGKPLFRHSLDWLAALAAQRQDCTLTVVSRYQEILTTAAAMGLSAVESPDSGKGISYTIRAGIGSLPPLSPADFLLFVVADQPWLRRGTVERLLQAAKPGLWAAIATFGDRVGNPTLFSAPLAPALLALEADQGGRSILKRDPQRCLRVAAQEEKELWDVDYREQISIATQKKGNTCLSDDTN